MIHGLLARILQLLIAPSKAWRTIAQEEAEASSVYNNFFYPLLGIMALAQLLHRVCYMGEELPSALQGVVVAIVSNYASFYLFAHAAQWTFQRIHLQQEPQKMLRFSGYMVGMSMVFAVLFALFPPCVQGWYILVNLLLLVRVTYAGAGVFLELQKSLQLPFALLASLSLAALLEGLMRLLQIAMQLNQLI